MCLKMIAVGKLFIDRVLFKPLLVKLSVSIKWAERGEYLGTVTVTS